MLIFKSKIKKMEISKDFVFWDPAGEKIQQNSFQEDRKKLEEQYAKYQINPRLPLRNLVLFLLLIVAEIILLVAYPNISNSLLNARDGMYFLIIPVLPIIYYVYRIYALQRDLVKMLIAKEHGWIYAPNENSTHWMQFAAEFPDFFQKGNEGQNMQDEFWGKFKGTKQEVDFYSSIFEYKVVTHNSKRRNVTIYRKTIFSLKLNKKIQADFRLEPEGLLEKFFNFFRRNKEINTEFAEFNKTFAVFYAGKKVEKELEIIKTLSPATQVKLLDLKKSEGPFSILFRGDTVIFMFDGMLLKNMYTNFFRKVELDSRDKESLSQKLNIILKISSEIVPFLD